MTKTLNGHERISKDPAYLRRNDKSEGNFNRAKVAICAEQMAGPRDGQLLLLLLLLNVISLLEGREETATLKPRRLSES